MIANILGRRLDVKDLGLEKVRMWVIFATLNKIQLHWIAMKSRVTLERTPACQVNMYVERQKPTCPS